MVRTQVRLDDQQLRALREISAASGESVAALVRRGVDQYLRSRTEVPREERIRRALRVGRFRSGSADGSAAHDRHLAEAFSR
ncbi:MAG: ribbon-helix-helix protein, CopG family [Bryobacteraceae bacterium]